MTIQNRFILIGIIGFIGTFFINLLVQYNYPSYKNLIFHRQWQESFWIAIYLLFLISFIIGILYFIFGKKLETNSIDKKASYLRLIVAVPLFLFGAFLSSVSIFDLGWDRVDSFTFGSLYMYSSYLVFIPLRNRVSLPKILTNKSLVYIAIGLCLTVFILPTLKYLIKSKYYSSFIFSSYENGYIFSLFAIAFAIGINLKLERGSGHKLVFIALGTSLIIVLTLIISMVVSVISSLA